MRLFHLVFSETHLNGSSTSASEPERGPSPKQQEPRPPSEGTDRGEGGAVEEKEEEDVKKEKDSVVYNIHLSLPGVSQTVDILVNRNSRRVSLL